ncbi:MAG: nuclear transport factor 2 family protein [Roseiflexaceae bacterium]
MTSAIAIVQAWQAAANDQNIDRLLELSAPDIVIIGPRGRGSGHQLLGEWIARAGLTLSTQRVFQRGDTVVLAQHGTWQSSATGGVPSAADLASRFRIHNERVIEFERYEELADALTAANMSDADEQPSAT